MSRITDEIVAAIGGHKRITLAEEQGGMGNVIGIYVDKEAFDRLLKVLELSIEQRNSELDRIYALGMASALVTEGDAAEYNQALISLAAGEVGK